MQKSASGICTEDELCNSFLCVQQTGYDRQLSFHLYCRDWRDSVYWSCSKNQKRSRNKSSTDSTVSNPIKDRYILNSSFIKGAFGCIARSNCLEYVGAVDFYLFHVSVLGLLRFQKLGRSLKTALKFSLNQNLNSSILFDPILSLIPFSNNSRKPSPIVQPTVNFYNLQQL